MPRVPENRLRLGGRRREAAAAGNVRRKGPGVTGRYGPGVTVELRDVTPGVWIWRLPHPDWTPDAEWSPPVACTCVESGGEVVLLDPIAPPER